MNSLSFEEIEPGVGAGFPVPPGWHSIAGQTILIIVGCTGAGKTATIKALADEGIALAVLPNRRMLTDRMIIKPMMSEKGLSQKLDVIDRIERFAYTRQFRERFPGGMAYVLSKLYIDPVQIQGHFVFDGLRGSNEVDFASRKLPRAYFVVLNSSDEIRLLRLLNRNDAFDRIRFARPNGDMAKNEPLDFASLENTDTSLKFNLEQEKMLSDLVRRGSITADDLRAKLKIIVEERRNYNLNEAITSLNSTAPARTHIFDTTAQSPPQIAKKIIANCGMF